MMKMKRMGFALLMLLPVLPLVAQEKPDTAYVFRFVPQKDVFYVPFGNNGAELDRLCTVLTGHIDRLRAGQMYICVSSYAASGNAEMNECRMAYLRMSRVKSELITRAGITERMFVTDRRITAPYADTLRNVVVITFPASVEQIERIAGAQAAETVRAYYREIEDRKQTEIQARQAAEEQRRQAATAREAAARREAEADRQRAAEAKQAAAEQAERERLESEERARLAAEAAAKPHTLALRANLLRWATLTPDLGIEWRISRDWGVAVDGTWTSWSWNDGNRRYALWEVSPAIHYYIGKQKRGYVGAMYHIGQFNYKLRGDGDGKQGDLQGGGITGGYRLPLGKCLMLDFNLGIGCTHASYDTYTVTDGVKVRTGNHSKNYWGINKAGVTLVWKLF